MKEITNYLKKKKFVTNSSYFGVVILEKARISSFVSKVPLKYAAQFVVSLGTLMATLSAGITNTALPIIADDFNVSLSRVQWVVSSYMLTIACLLPVFGKIADSVGRKKIYSAGLVIFSFGALFCSLSVSIWMLVFFRVIQALGACMMMSNTLAIITSVYPEDERGRAMGISNTVVAVGSLIGPGLGGVLIDIFSWHFVFSLISPIGIFAYLLAQKILPYNLGSTGNESKNFDTRGAFIFAAAMLCFMFVLTEGNVQGEDEFRSTFLFVSILLFLIFFINEINHPNPIIDLGLFKNNMLLCGILASFFSFISLRGINLILPFYFKEILQYTAAEIGLVLTSIPLAMAIFAPFAGRLSDSIQPVIITTSGLIITFFGHYSLLQLGLESTKFDIYLRLFLIGAGRGLFQAPNNSCIMGTVGTSKLGVAGSLVSLVRNVASVLGITLTAVIFHNLKSSYAVFFYGNLNFLKKLVFLYSFKIIIKISCIMLLFGIIVSILRGKKLKKH